NSREVFSEESRKYLELNLLISIAAACGLYSLAQPIVQLLFGRGHFSLNDVIIASEILKTYCWILIFASGVRVLTPAYYAVKNTWLPAVISGGCFLIHIFLAPYLMSKYQVHGLMMSTMTTAGINMLMLLVLYSKFIHKFNYKQYTKNVIKFILIGASVFGITQIYYLMEGSFPANNYGVGFNLILTLMAAAAMFIVACHFLKVDFIHEVLSKIQSRLARVKK
ncbi:MAG: polysaccharide biosynthesis C-terminal domain-containing protein, partial [Moraxellaceae bacterium]|nr:polysaccharide biosynthesis C-terminal domain-containing protein [Pseudobdellovibrionaceae bacterium]